MRHLLFASALMLGLGSPSLAQSPYPTPAPSTVPGLNDPAPPLPSFSDPGQGTEPETTPGTKPGGKPGAKLETPPGQMPDATPGRNITATGKTMPPATGRMQSPSALKASTEAEMIKAQKETEARNKAWDAKMRKTMGSICTGC